MSASSNENRNTRRAFPRRRWLCVAGVLLYGASTIVKAYEVETHRRLTLAAFERSHPGGFDARAACGTRRQRFG